MQLRILTTYRFLLLLFVAAQMMGCDSEKMQQTEFVAQQNLFLQSLELVESAGAILQSANVSKDNIDLAMNKMDRGLKQAFQVDKAFLQKLDVRLPRLYSESFIVGVENYRIGVESADRAKQIEGLNLLSQWGEFWLQEKPNIQQKLMSLNS